VLHAARCKCRTPKSRLKSPSRHHPTTLSGYIFATKAGIDNRKKPVKQQYLFYMSHNMVNFSPLAAEIVSGVWGTPSGNFNGFRVLAALLHGTPALDIGCLPYFHTWCSLSANLGCRSETCCTRPAENTGRKKSPSEHHRATLSGYMLATKAYIDNRKKNLLSSNTSPRYATIW